MQYNRIEIHFCYIKLLQFLYKIHNNIDVIFLTPKALCKKRGDLSLCNCIHYFPVIGLAIYKTNVFKKLCENSAGTKNNYPFTNRIIHYTEKQFSSGIHSAH